MAFQQPPFQIALAGNFFYNCEETLFTCTFYCLLGGAAFPDDQWTDFAATVLDWWAEELLRVSGRKQATFELALRGRPFPARRPQGRRARPAARHDRPAGRRRA